MKLECIAELFRTLLAKEARAMIKFESNEKDERWLCGFAKPNDA